MCCELTQTWTLFCWDNFDKYRHIFDINTYITFFYLDLGDLELRASAFLIIDIHRGLLRIQETQDLDAGDYTCVATNEAGRAAGKITLDVGCK